MAKIKRDPKKVALAQAILDAYQPKSAEEMNDALKDLFGPMFEAMLKGELNHHLGYESNDKSQKKDDNRRNGYGKKQIKTTQGDIAINVPRDRDGSFEPQLGSGYVCARHVAKRYLLDDRGYLWLQHVT